MNNRLFAQFQTAIMAELGIKITSAKRTMLQSRLGRRLRARGISSYEEYFDFVFNTPAGREEIQPFIDAITTNKTDFFREPRHFDYLTRQALPQILADMNLAAHRGIKIWSAGCSSGEEPYTLAMVTSEFSRYTRNCHCLIYASDVSSTVLQRAKLAVYPHSLAEPIPGGLRKRYLLKSKDREKNQVRIVPELRAKIRFIRINFMDKDYALPSKVQIIFCRNVLIYFDQATQKTILTRMCRHLLPGGYLFIGHSETLNNLNLPLTAVGPTIYRRHP